MSFVSDLIEWVLSKLGGLLSTAVSVVFGFFYDLFKYIYIGIKDFISDSYFADVGEDFFNFISSFFNGSISFNIVFWAVGLFLVFFVLRRIALPFIVALIDSLIDGFTPS